jgi:penicillin-binding protein A
MTKRIRWFGVAMILFFCGLLIQLDNIQGLKANQYQHAPLNPVTVEDEYAEPRGIIVSSDGVVLAESKPTPSSPYYKYERYYPTGSLFSQIVGFTSFKYGTDTGVEAQYNSELTFRTQPFQNLDDLITTEQGTDTVVLTVSDKLQSLAQQALGNKEGAVVVLDPSNGAVLAMYSNPTFDPNLLASQSTSTEEAGWATYNAAGPHGFVNGLPMAFDTGFAPGSTFKVITSAAAYDHDPQLTTRSFPYLSAYPPPGTNLLIHNDSGGACGGTIQVMLPVSCDTGFASMGIQLGAANLVDEAASFGFGARPPIDLPTNPSAVSCVTLTTTTPCMSAISLEDNQPFVAYSAIGQGDVLATPLQMAMVASAIADDGVIMKPHVMARILDPKDNVIQTYQPTQWIRATSPKTASAVSSLMQLVVSKPPPQEGTAYGIFPSDWQVAAKTGTAQEPGGTTDWMIAFAPASHPEVAIAVVVPDQGISATGALVSGPIVKTVLSGLPGIFGSNG